MKKIRLNLVLTLTVIISALWACQPKDATIAKPDDVRTNSNGAGNNLSGIEIKKLLSHTLDRHMEPLHLLKSVLNSQYADEHGLALIINPTTQQKKLTAKNSLQTFVTPEYSSEYALNYEVEVLELDGSGKLMALILKSSVGIINQSRGIINSGTSKPIDFKVLAKTEFISIKATATENIYTITTERADDSSSFADKQSYIFSAIVSTFEWAGTVPTLDNDIPLKLSLLEVNRKGVKTGFLSYQEFSSTLVVKLGQCISANGKITLSQKSKVKGTDKMTPVKISNTVVNVSDSSFEIDGFQSTAKDCATRPVVDLTRML